MTNRGTVKTELQKQLDVLQLFLQGCLVTRIKSVSLLAVLNMTSVVISGILRYTLEVIEKKTRDIFPVFCTVHLLNR